MRKWIPISAYTKLKRMNYQQFNSFIGSCIETVIKQREEQKDEESLNEIQVRQALEKDFSEKDISKILSLLNIKLYEQDKYSYICGECGKELYGKYQYCPHCGGNLEWEEEDDE